MPITHYEDEIVEYSYLKSYSEYVRQCLEIRHSSNFFITCIGVTALKCVFYSSMV